MRNASRVLFPLSAAALIFVAAPTEAHAKCVESIGHPVLPGYLFIVDGEVMGEYAMGEEAPYPPSEEILRLEVTCRPAVSSRRRGARQAAVVVVTKSGARTLLRSYLEDLVEDQRQHHARHGEYAATPEELDFFATRVALPIHIDVSDDSWSATATVEGSDLTCQVASRDFDGAGHVVRSGAIPRPQARPEIPRCSRVE